MAAELFYLPPPTAFTSNGLPAAGAKAYFYYTGTTDPADVFTTAALTTVHANPVVADSSGHLPQIYLDDSVTYKLIIRDRNGIQLGSTVDPYIPAVFSVMVVGDTQPFVTVKDFGATGDGTTDDGAAFVAAIAYLKSIAVNDLGFNLKASNKLYVPAGHYFLGTTTLDITHTLTIEGDGTGQAGGGACRLRWTAGTTGIRLQHKNTSGASTYDAVAHFGADGSTIRGLWLDGGFAGTESEAHGIHAKVRFTAEDCIIENFPGDGIYSNVVAGSANATEGNANCSSVSRVRISACRNGLFVDGADTNAWQIAGLDASGNRAWGVYDSSFLGNSYYGCHVAANGFGYYGNGSSTPVSLVSYSGKYYSLVIGGNANNAPSGTTDHNADWLYVSNGGPGASFPTWVSGLNVRSGGAYATDNANARSVFSGCYSESGQASSQIVTPSIVIGGTHGAGVVSNGLYIRSGTPLGGGGATLGFESGTLDHAFALKATGSHNFLTFYGGAAAATLLGYLDSRPSYGLELYDLNGAKIIGARKTGWATATGTATRTTFDTATVTLPQLAERLKALIDDIHGAAGATGHGLIGT